MNNAKALRSRTLAHFTIIVEYRGGTYISQVEARTPAEALCCWAKGVSPSLIVSGGQEARNSGGCVGVGGMR
jgi:hypothetical protein